MSRKDSPERIKRRALEMRAMIREAAENMALVGMDYVHNFPAEHVERRRIWADVPDRRSLTGRLLGDPIPERSALRYNTRPAFSLRATSTGSTGSAS